jgi:hypothetical protein
LRKVLAAPLSGNAKSWRIGDWRSRLGAALVSIAVTDPTLDAEGRRAKLSQAEASLLEGHEQLQKPSAVEKYKRDALARMVRLYEAWNKPDKRSEWQQRLELFDKSQTQSLPSENSAARAETK